jgi:hypothetical protein
MATLSGNISKQNIVDRFADYVVTTANDSIHWGIPNNKPFTEMPDAVFGGPKTGRSIGITGSSITGTIVAASVIRETLLDETNIYIRIRKMRAILNVTGAGGNTGTRPTAGVVFDNTAKSYLSQDALNYANQIGTPTGANALITAASSYPGTTADTVSVTNLQAYFEYLKDQYIAKRDNTVTLQVDVCHASCHSSCHASRSRR